MHAGTIQSTELSCVLRERTLLCCLSVLKSHKNITCQQRTVCSGMERNQSLLQQDQLYSYAVA